MGAGGSVLAERGDDRNWQHGQLGPSMGCKEGTGARGSAQGPYQVDHQSGVGAIPHARIRAAAIGVGVKGLDGARVGRGVEAY